MQISAPRRAASRSSRLITVLATLAATVFLYLRSFLLPATPIQALDDQQQFFARGVHIFHGQVPFRDFFAFITPGTEYLYAAGFRVFGLHSWVIAGWHIAVGLAFCLLLTWMAARTLPPRLHLLPALLFLSLDFQGSPSLTHHWFSTLAALAAAAVLMPGITLPRVAASGALCAAATLFTQTAGVAAFIAIAIYLVWQAKTAPPDAPRSPRIPARLAALTTTCAGILGVVLGLFAHAAGLSQVYFQLVLFPLRYFPTQSSNRFNVYLQQFPAGHSPGDLLRFIPILFVSILVPYIYLLGLFRIARRRAALPAALRQDLVLLNLVGIFLFLSVLHSPRFFRLSTIVAPGILICVWLLSEPGRIRSAIRSGLAALGVAFAVVLPIYRQVQWHRSLDLPIGRTAFTDRLELPEYAWFAARTRPGDTLFNNSALMLYLDLRNPTGLEYVTTHEFTRPEWIARIVAEMQADPPAFITLERQHDLRPRPGDHTAPFVEFVHRNYVSVAVFPLNQGVPYEEEIWQRKDLAARVAP